MTTPKEGAASAPKVIRWRQIHVEEGEWRYGPLPTHVDPTYWNRMEICYAGAPAALSKGEAAP